MTGPSRPKMSLLGAFGWFAASYGLAILGYLMANAIASRWLGVAEYGYFVIAITVSTVVGQLALMGAHRAGLRDAAVMADDDEAILVQLRGGASAALRISVPIASVAGGIVVFIIRDDDEVASRLLMAVGFAFLVALGGMQKLWANYLRGLGDIRWASLLEGRSGGAAVSVLQAAGLGLVWWLAPQSGLAGALAALTLGFAVPVLYAGRRVSRRWRHLPRNHHLLRDLRESWSRSWKFALNQMATYLGGTIEIWLAGLILVAADASLFSAAQRLALLLAIPLTSVQVVVAPVCARLLASGQTRRLERVLRTGATLAAVASSVLWLPMLVFPGASLRLVFGEPFAAGATTLFLLTIGNAANVLSGMCGTALTMSRHEGVVAGVQGGSVLLRVVIGSLAAIQWGLTGLAASAAALTMVVYLVLWWQARVLLGLRTHATLRPSLSVIRRTEG